MPPHHDSGVWESKSVRLRASAGCNTHISMRTLEKGARDFSAGTPLRIIALVWSIDRIITRKDAWGTFEVGSVRQSREAQAGFSEENHRWLLEGACTTSPATERRPAQTSGYAMYTQGGQPGGARVQAGTLVSGVQTMSGKRAWPSEVLPLQRESASGAAGAASS